MDTTRKSYMWTKDNIKQVINLWDTHTSSQLCEKLGCRAFQLQHIAKNLRRNGVVLPKKHTRGKIDSLIKEVIAEMPTSTKTN